MILIIELPTRRLDDTINACRGSLLGSHSRLMTGPCCWNNI